MKPLRLSAGAGFSWRYSPLGVNHQVANGNPLSACVCVYVCVRFCAAEVMKVTALWPPSSPCGWAIPRVTLAAANKQTKHTKTKQQNKKRNLHYEIIKKKGRKLMAGAAVTNVYNCFFGGGFNFPRAAIGRFPSISVAN